MNKFKPLKARMRATFAAGATVEPRLENVDKENEVLHGVQITLEGEAKGHGVWLDRAFCEAVAEQGNAMGDAGVKVRFGHPAMCSDALGTYPPCSLSLIQTYFVYLPPPIFLISPFSTRSASAL